ncbi:MAG: MATE family efflux transporter [Sphingomonadaceae bacterium]
MSETAKLTRGTIRGHLVSQTLPNVLGVAALMSVALLNAYYIGRLGSAELAAVAFIFPVVIAVSSLGVGVMVGINSVIARALGSGDVEQAARRANFGAIFALATGAGLGLSLYLLIDPLFTLMQAEASLRPLIREFMAPYALGLPLLLLQMALNGVLRGQGEARMNSLISLAYAAINWLLNPFLITGALGIGGLGLAGAAYAMLIGYGFACLLALWFIARTHLPINPALIRQCRMGESARAIMRVAGPAALSNAINPVGLAVLTGLLAAEGQAAVAGFGAAGRLQSFAVVPLLALSGSIGAIVGQNWGAGEHARARLALYEAGLFCLAYGFGTGALLWLYGDWFGGLFSSDPAVINAFSMYLAISVWGYAGFGLLIVANGALNAVDRSGYALAQSFARVFLLMLPFAWLLRGTWGANAIYSAELVANLGGGVVAAAVAWRVLASAPVR